MYKSVTSSFLETILKEAFLLDDIFPYDIIEACLGQLHVVEEGRVRIHIWITTLVNHLGFRVNLEEGYFVQIGQKRKTIEDLQILV